MRSQSRRKMWPVLALLIFSVVVGVYFYATFVIHWMCGPVPGVDAEQAARHACSGTGSHLAPT
ncbi:MAG TPA: hypothetical protein VGX03_22945 [Candidatus Binatia bacterium]|jgi:hypothetical protein|nr:hypothetical protein [Candidatus Binatia bacterium]